ncbi:MAG: YdcF family protein [Oscillospiraceae bacterium]|jgi:uncharacterized SAM-binding protein YcdF (DUF218 family)|nr:YdcF family protein [Oscillospiraceae bacterium]
MINEILRDVTDFIFLEDPPRPVDILFLPGGSDPAIPERAAELYHAGWAPLLLPSGGVSVKTGKFDGVKRKQDVYDLGYRTDCDFYADVLRKNGVPDAAILREDRSGFTKENALFSRRETDRRGLDIRTGMIVCKSFHARRCLICYQLAYPETELTVAPVDVYGIARENWHETAYGVERVLGELARCGNQFTEELKALAGE